jgi:tetratricopeptide (TPR) repeat protein
LRVLCVFAAPAAFLLLLEGGLRLGGVGYPTSFFIKSEQPGVLTTNIRFGWHYQQETLTEPEPCLVPRDKPKDTIRIFVLGESAALGTPDPSFGFARILEVMLGATFPHTRFEVVNAAMRGINSHVIVPIAKECARLDPDLFLVYMGNNELNGLYGPKTPVAFFGRHPTLIPALHRIKQTRTAQLLRRAFGINPEAVSKKRKPPTAEFFQGYRTARDDPERDHVYRNFRRNLGRICGYGLKAGAGVILSTVAVNLRDCPPLGSLHSTGLTEPQRQEWERLYRTGVGLETTGDQAQARACYEQAAALDDHYAELHFRWARCHLHAGDREAARRHFVLANDWDALPFRADTRLNDIVREVAASSDFGLRIADFGLKKAAAANPQSAIHDVVTPDSDPGPKSGLSPVRLVETDTALATSQQCPDGIPGREFFYEHVHLRFDGDYEAARALLPAVIQSLAERGLAPEVAGQTKEDGISNPQSAIRNIVTPDSDPGPQSESESLPALTREQCAQALAFTAWDEVNTAAAMVKLTAKPPFTGQLEHAQRQAAAEKAISAVTDRIDGAFVEQVIRTYHQAIDARPQDWHLRYNLGTLLHQLERPQEAAAQFDVVVRTLPHVASFRVLLGYALGKAGLPDQAGEQFRQALKRDSHYREAREGLKWAQTMKGRIGR